VSLDSKTVRVSLEIAVNLFVVFLIIAWCLQILMPFAGVILWGTVIGISAYKPFCSVRERTGGKLAVTLFALVGLGIVLVPAWLFAASIFESIRGFAEAVNAGSFAVPLPSERVQEWPLVGERIFEAWSAAATNFESFLEAYSGQLKDVAAFAAGKAARLGVTVLMFVFSIVIAVAMLANDVAIKAAMHRLFARLVGEERADDVLSLTTATIRSVTMGVLGVAFIQAVLGGLGMVVAGVPGAGVWAVVILVLAIAQLPPLLVLLPAMIYVFAHASTTMAVVFMVWSIAVSFSDSLLKPLLLGRGVDVPTLVILLGAIGGMIMSGILGLFVGAVVLALGYKMLIAWLDLAPLDEAQSRSDPAPTS
jgi:predicted PurR-regulated permease PerM